MDVRRRVLTEAEWQEFKRRNWPADVPRECPTPHVWTMGGGGTCVVCETAVRLMQEFVTQGDKGSDARTGLLRAGWREDVRRFPWSWKEPGLGAWHTLDDALAVERTRVKITQRRKR